MNNNNEKIYIVYWGNYNSAVYHEFENKLYYYELDYEFADWYQSGFQTMKSFKEHVFKNNNNLYDLLLEFEEENNDSPLYKHIKLKDIRVGDAIQYVNELFFIDKIDDNYIYYSTINSRNLNEQNSMSIGSFSDKGDILIYREELEKNNDRIFILYYDDYKDYTIYQEIDDKLYYLISSIISSDQWGMSFTKNSDELIDRNKKVIGQYLYELKENGDIVLLTGNDSQENGTDVNSANEYNSSNKLEFIYTIIDNEFLNNEQKINIMKEVLK
jgi:hypothetical protein